jgi:hypothetical protein
MKIGLIYLVADEEAKRSLEVRSMKLEGMKNEEMKELGDF